LRLDDQEIGPFLEQYEKDAEAIIKEISQLVMYANVGYQEAWHMSTKEREILVSTLTEKLKAEAGKPAGDQL
jgi:hypothetical protein